MFNRVGLQTPRGSGTNGHVQFNKFLAKPHAHKIAGDSSKGYEWHREREIAGVIWKPEKEMPEHDRKRQIELKLLVLEEKLIDQGCTDAEIAEKLDSTRKSLQRN